MDTQGELLGYGSCPPPCCENGPTWGRGRGLQHSLGYHQSISVASLCTGPDAKGGGGEGSQHEGGGVPAHAVF